MRYRKIPVIIDAIKWTGLNLREVIDFTGQHKSVEGMSWNEYELLVKNNGLKIFTLEGTHTVSIDDFIIKGIAGEFYPCKPDIFAVTYEGV